MAARGLALGQEMDFADLLDGDLTSALGGLGLSDSNISDLGRNVGEQLLGGDGFDLSDLLTGLDAESFLGKVDVAGLAEAVGISPELANRALAMLAPKVADFMGGDTSPLGSVGKLASKLFD